MGKGRYLWQVVVNDHLDPLEVHPAGHQVGANKHPYIPHTEPSAEHKYNIRNSAFSLLAIVCMNA